MLRHTRFNALAPMVATATLAATLSLVGLAGLGAAPNDVLINPGDDPAAAITRLQPGDRLHLWRRHL